MPPMVETQNLRKEYKDLVAVQDLSLSLEKGDIFGFIGPNGAGKTTSIKMMATLLLPTSGKAFIDGIDVVEHPDAIRALVGYMPDFFGVYDDIKVWEYLDFFAAAYRIPKIKRPAVIKDVLELTDLSIKRDSYVESLSRGMKQRLCLAKTLVHDPKVLLLDEPASGLDPRARIEIKELLRELQSMGKTIIISSHILPEMEEFCNKIGIIERGHLIVAGDVQSIAREVRGHQTLEIGIVEDLPRAQVILAGMSDQIAEVQVSTGRYMEHGTAARNGAATEPAETPQDLAPERYGLLLASYTGEPDEEYRILTTLVMAGVKVRSFQIQQTNLEDVFLRVTKGQVA